MTVQQPCQPPLLPRAARIAAALTLATLLVALIVDMGFAAQARQWLQFSFPAQHASLHLAAVIFLHNLRELIAVAAVELIAYAPAAAGRVPTVADRLYRRGGEVMLAAGIANNVVVIGAALGAYGTRMLFAALPQGPLELAAYALALVTYLSARSQTPSLRLSLCAAAASVLLLSAAAILETWATV